MTRIALECKVFAVSTPKIPVRLTDEETPSSRMDAYTGPEQPTVKRPNPLSESSQRTTTKMKKADIDALVKNEKDASGTRPAVSDEQIAEYEQQAEARKTNP